MPILSTCDDDWLWAPNRYGWEQVFRIEITDNNANANWPIQMDKIKQSSFQFNLCFQFGWLVSSLTVLLQSQTMPRSSPFVVLPLVLSVSIILLGQGNHEIIV